MNGQGGTSVSRRWELVVLGVREAHRISVSINGSIG